MRKSITGHVGDSKSRSALESLARSASRVTLFVHDGRVERVIHFAPQEVCLLEFPRTELSESVTEPLGIGGAAPPVPPSLATPETPKPGGAPVAYTAAAKALLHQQLDEVSASLGALFELREGPVPERVLASDRTLRLRASSGELLAGWDPRGTSERDGESPREGVLPEDPAAKLRLLSQALRGAVSRGILLAEMGSVWQTLGSPSRAASCFKEAALEALEWDAVDRALELLEEALRSCPLDVDAAETAALLAQAEGRTREAEEVAEKVSTQLEGARLHELGAQFYRALGRAPESPTLRRMGAEALIRAGDAPAGTKEMWAAATAFESLGEGDAAARAAARVLELDPGHGEARLALRRLTRRRSLVRLAFRWGTLAAAILLACAWFALDSSSASAFARVKDMQEGRDPRQAVVDLRDEASRFPLSRHAARIAELESGLYEKALAEDWSLLSLAIESLEGGDVSRADHLAGVLRARSLVPLVKVRAAELAREVALRTDRQEKLLGVARAHVAAGRYADAYPLFADLLRGARRDLFAANYQVPVRIETVPSGATVTIDRRVSGKSPAWCLLPSDPASVLALEARGYDGYRRVDPLGGVLAGGAARLRVVLDLPRLWARAVPGGPLATDAGAASNPCLLGGDGVLRSFEASGQLRWETPIDPECDLSLPPRFAGPCILIASRSGKVIAHALSHGRRVWAAQIQGPRDRGGLVLGPMVGGQVLVFARGAALLIHPWTGFLVRRIASGAGEFSGQVGVLGDRGFLALGRGGMAVVDFASGRLESVREPERKIRWLGAGEGKVFRLDEDGRLGALGPDGRASLWERKLGPEYSFAALVDGNILCVASPRSGIQGLECDTGAPLWKAQPEGSVTALLVAGSRLGIRVDRGGDGVLVILGVGDGAPRWEVDCRPGENASFGPAADALLISTPSAGLRAFRAPQS